MATIRRIKRKVKGKFRYFVQVKEGNKVKSTVKWSPTKPLKTLLLKYETDLTLKPNERRFKVSKAIEVTRDDDKKPNRSFAVRASLTIDKKKITATSMNLKWGSLNEARREAVDRLFMRVHEHFTGGYDADEGKKLVIERGQFSQIRFQTVYYR